VLTVRAGMKTDVFWTAALCLKTPLITASIFHLQSHTVLDFFFLNVASVSNITNKYIFRISFCIICKLSVLADQLTVRHAVANSITCASRVQIASKQCLKITRNMWLGTVSRILVGEPRDRGLVPGQRRHFLLNRTDRMLRVFYFVWNVEGCH